MKNKKRKKKSKPTKKILEKNSSNQKQIIVQLEPKVKHADRRLEYF